MQPQYQHYGIWGAAQTSGSTISYIAHCKLYSGTCFVIYTCSTNIQACAKCHHVQWEIDYPIIQVSITLGIAEDQALCLTECKGLICTKPFYGCDLDNKLQND